MIEIKKNTIESDVYGSYPFSSNESGAGIVAHTGLEREKPGLKVEIDENTIKLDKLNYSKIHDSPRMVKHLLRKQHSKTRRE